MYDYIIIGAGSAGCVMANRLSQDPTKKVCLVEAGPRDTSQLIQVPFGLALLARLKSVNWGHTTAADPALNNRKLYWPRGRVLGGSSSVNAMIYIRGHKADYHAWEKAAGPEWSWQCALDIFKSHEANEDLNNDFHGTSGPLNVANLRKANPISKSFTQAAPKIGTTQNDDFNGARQEGLGLYQVTQKNGQRFSAARAFLDPVRGRENLTILTNTQVAKVLFQDRKASGVSIRGGKIELNKGGEIILSGGAINSPQLLMLSGIGPADHLREHGIDVLQDTPEVGQNLTDHFDISVSAKASNHLPIAISPRFLPRAIKAFWQYVSKRQGEFTSNVAEAGGFVKSDPAQPRANLQLHFLPAYLRDHGRKTAFGYGMTLHVCDLLPKSRGEIRLNSAHPSVSPKIIPRYLSHPDDVQTLLNGYKIARKLLASAVMQPHVAHEVQPGETVQSDADLIADIRARGETIYHPVGTCRMGTDAASVVDSQARVRGVSGLRVVDASIMPNIVAGNTNAPTMMIAENVSRMMRNR